ARLPTLSNRDASCSITEFTTAAPHARLSAGPASFADSAIAFDDGSIIPRINCCVFATGSYVGAWAIATPASSNTPMTRIFPLLYLKLKFPPMAGIFNTVPRSFALVSEVSEVSADQVFAADLEVL